MADIDAFFFALPLIVFAAVLGLWIVVFVLGSRLSRCKKCGKAFHDIDDVLLRITPFGIKAIHGYPCRRR